MYIYICVFVLLIFSELVTTPHIMLLRVYRWRALVMGDVDVCVCVLLMYVCVFYSCLDDSLLPLTSCYCADIGGEHS